MYKIIVHNIFAAANTITFKLLLLIGIINTKAIGNNYNNNNKAKINIRVKFLI